MRFASTHSGDQAQTVSFADYVARMKEGQDKIYYVTADTFAAASNSPHLEIFRKKGIEVLLLSDRVDEWMLSYLREFDGKSLVSVAKGGLDLAELADEEEKKHQAEVAEDFKPLVERLQKTLEDQVKEVRVTLRLVDSPPAWWWARTNSARICCACSRPPARKRPTSSRCWRSTPSTRCWPASARLRTTSSTSGHACCWTRRCWPKAPRSPTRRPSSSA